MSHRFIGIGAALGFVGVAAGAFGAHALRALRSEAELRTFDTGARYLLAHAVVVVALGVAEALGLRLAHLGLAAGLLTAGAVVFAGSLFLLVLLEVRALGAITPIGGVLLLAGWAALAASAARRA